MKTRKHSHPALAHFKRDPAGVRLVALLILHSPRILRETWKWALLVGNNDDIIFNVMMLLLFYTTF